MRDGRYHTRAYAKRSVREGSVSDVLVVIIIVSVLAGVGIPRYFSLRPVIKARDCKERIIALTSSHSAFILQEGRLAYGPSKGYKGALAALGGIMARLEGLPANPVCPLDRTPYDIISDSAGSLIIRCPNARAHAKVLPVLKDYIRRGQAPKPDYIP